MANVDNSIQGGLMELWLRESGTSDPRQVLICYLDIPLQITNEVNEKDSSCGTHVRVKDAKGTISGNAVVNIAPTSTEVSYDQFVAWQLAKTVLEYEYQNAEDTINGVAYEAGELVRFTGTATIIDSTLTPTVGESIEFSFQMKLSTLTKELSS